MAENLIRGTRTVRSEDAIDVDRLTAWLADTVPAEAPTGTPTIRQFSGGASNLTYLLRFADRDLIVRQPPRGDKPAGAAHDMAREYRIQSALAPVFPYVPRTIALCEDTSVIGSPFYVMERVDGVIPRGKDFPPEMRLTASQARNLCRNMFDVLIDLHRLDADAVGLGWLAKGDGYVGRQVRGWAERYRRVKTWNVGSFGAVIDWLESHQSPDRGAALIHNDFRLDNMVFDRHRPTRVAALLDWELATVGDPLMDLGNALAYWIQNDDGPVIRFFRRQPSTALGMMSRDQIVDYYCRRTGIGLDDREWAFYEVFGLFRLAVIAQQIYYRYHHRQTTNKAFRFFGIAVVMLEGRCRRIIRRYQ